jgi:DNA-directed RNA polymerase specialized sigma24 family protein
MIGQARSAGPRRCAVTRVIPPAGLTRVGLMQPPTEPTRAAVPKRRPGPRGDEDELYRRHHRELHRAVALAVNAPRELIEDACQNAWAILLRAQPERISIFGWLYVVATREAFRLRERDRRHIHLEAMLPGGSWDAVIADAFSTDDILEAREALEILAGLPDRQRTDLTLLVAGFSYVEIAEMTGGRTYTNVNKHIAKARAHVRLGRLMTPAHSRRALSRTPHGLG